MVYGLNVTPEHGYYVNTEELDGSFDKVELIDPTPDEGKKPGGLYSGRHVKPDNVPKRMKWLGRRGHSVPDFDRQLCLNVSARAKALIESFEPGVHQFIPVEYLNGKGDHREHRFFFIVGNRLDSLDHDKTTMVLAYGRLWVPARDLSDQPDLIPPDFDVTVKPKMVFNRAQIGAAHIWCDKHLTTGGPYISRDFASALKASGFSGLGLSENGVETV